MYIYVNNTFISYDRWHVGIESEDLKLDQEWTYEHHHWNKRFSLTLR